MRTCQVEYPALPKGDEWRGKISERNVEIYRAYTMTQKTLAELADEFEITRERVRQIVGKIAFRINRLKRASVLADEAEASQ